MASWHKGKYAYSAAHGHLEGLIYQLAGGDWQFPAKPFMWKLAGLVRAGARLSAVVSDPVTTSVTGDVVNPTTHWEPTVTWDLVVYFRVLHGV